MTKRDITPAALIVVTILGLVTLWLAAVTGLLYLRGELDAAKDAGILLGAASTGLVAVLAKTGNTPTPEPGQTTVTTDTGTPVTTGAPLVVGESAQTTEVADLDFAP